MSATAALVAGLRPPRSRFAGRELSDLLGVQGPVGLFDDEVWQLAGHPALSSSASTKSVRFSGVPCHLREALKELVVLSVMPFRHCAASPQLLGAPPRSLETALRWLADLGRDLGWLATRAGSLDRVHQRDLDAWLAEQGARPAYNRVVALKAFARYGPAMTPGLQRLHMTPWRGRTAASVAGCRGPLPRVNSTLPLPMDVYGPYLQAALVLIDRGEQILEALTELPNRGWGEWTEPKWYGWRDPAWLDEEGAGDRDRVEWARGLAAAAHFAAAAFSGMRRGELETIPRGEPLLELEAAGARRWMLQAYLVKGLDTPRRERWLVPPIVARAVHLTLRLLELRRVPADSALASTGQAPLFDRRALVLYRTPYAASAAMRLDGSIAILRRTGAVLAAAGLTDPMPDQLINGRQMRRTLARIVASRPQGPQAAMSQFKWLSPETAAGYFVAAPDTMSSSQRELYDEIRGLQSEVALDVAVSEFRIWSREVDAGRKPLFPAGPDGRRKADAFSAVHEALGREPRVVEDGRRLRVLLRPHFERVHLTRFGLCDYDAGRALCGGVGGPAPEACRPNECSNMSTWPSTVAAHQLKYERLLALSRDRALPALARERMREEAELIRRDLGASLEAGDG